MIRNRDEACKESTKGKLCEGIRLYWILVLVALMPEAAGAQVPLIKSPETAIRPNQIISVEGPSDAALEARLKAIFSHIEAFKNIEVDVNDGVAVLSGKVLRAEALRKAGDLASRLEGVVYVENRIEEETDVETRVSPTIERIRQFLNKALMQLPVVGVSLLIVLLFYALSRLILFWGSPYLRLGIDPLMRNVIRQLLRLFILLIGLVIALEILDLTTLVGALVGTAGVVGIIFGFAFRNVAENYFAGLFLSVRSPFSVNDLVLVDTHEGRVVRLTSREMVLMTLDGNHVRIPNSIVYRSVIINFTRNPRRRFSFEVGIGVEEDLTVVQKIGCRALFKMKGVMSEPEPFMRTERLGEYNVVARFFGWVDQRSADFLKVRSEAVRTVKTALEKAGISMPEPTQTVQVQRKATDESRREEVAEAVHPAEMEPEAGEVDVAVDTQLDRQIEEDRVSSDEENLLNKA